MKQQYLFLFTCLVIVAGLMHSYYLFKDHFSPVHEYQVKLSTKHRELEREKLKLAMLENQFTDYRTEVAAILPNNELSIPVRALASVSRTALDPIEVSGGLLNQAKKDFRQGDYKTSIQTLNKMLAKYPSSPAVVEAQFFLAESYFLNGQSQECLDVIDAMMTHFPEHELTGYIMLRMGQVLASRNRSEEALEVYQVIQKRFSAQSELAAQARTMAQGLN